VGPYRGLSRGSTSVVAPLAATATVVPAVFGFMIGERPSPTALAGIALAVLGVALAGRSKSEGGQKLGRGVALPCWRRSSSGSASSPSTRPARTAWFGPCWQSPRVRCDPGHRVGPRHWAGDFAVDSGEGVYVSRVAVRASVPGDRAGDYAAVIAIGVLDLAAVGCSRWARRWGLSARSQPSARFTRSRPSCSSALCSGERMTREQVIGVAAAMAGVVAISAARRPATRQGQARRVAQRARPPTPR
jgi:hypothetical protein